ncbi:RagB/SusD family nutrient uptake outer membrane protein [Desertivirga arenae]|uniref:RagB/SusD family nutrient uptake outer membrane protein n=1 Tax=Desertivirga arenae TaxID=2810309 RepID=UPI001A967E0B|nr:RagB/SusD family nutrient uptake outer membrane protein [Pedobacter sp. SYSU D00823]
MRFQSKLKVPVLLIAAALTIISCRKDILDTVPNDRLSEELFWKSENDAKLAVNALYTRLDSTNVLAWDAMSDIAHTNQNFNTNAYIELGTYDATSPKVLSEWVLAYKGIRAANYFLDNVDKVPVTTPSLINQLKGEARTLRAYQYIKLASLYGDVPLITKSIGIEEGRSVSRNPVNEVWDFIDKELSESAALLPPSYTAAADKGRITKGAALALKARADLFAGRYENAAEAALQVMNLNVYDLYENYEKLFSYAAENNKEVILDKQFIKDSYPNNVFNLLAPYSQTGSSSYVPTRSLVDLYETSNGKSILDGTSGYDERNPYQNRDPRLKFSIFLDGDLLPSGIVFRPRSDSGTSDAIGNTYIASTTGFNIKKYINKEDYASPSNGGINIILLRYAEVLLTYAEAKIELNQIDNTVYDAINKVRNGRQDVKQPSIAIGRTQAELREIVRRERTVELAFEGLHFFDIRRWKTAEAVMQGPVYGISYVKPDNTLTTVQVVAVNRVFNKANHYLWPVPQKERDLNPSLSQNPNW